jgi:hypothetical protein
VQPGGGIQAVVLDPQNPGTIFTSTGDSGTSAGVYKSTDGAATWRAINSGLRAIGTSGLKIPRQKPATLYANAYDGMLLQSIDSGTSWRQLTSIDLLAIDPQEPATLFGFGPDGLTKSTDGSANWSPATVGLPNVQLVHMLESAAWIFAQSSGPQSAPARPAPPRRSR